MKTEAPFPPLLVHERGDLAHALAQRRLSLGLTCEEFDAHTGWADRFATKLENPHSPSGKLGFHFEFPTEFLPGGSVRCSGMAELWLTALGLRLVLVDGATADLIGAKPAPPRPPRTNPTAQGHARRRVVSGRYAAMSAPAFEVLDRTHVAAEAFRAAVIDHPYVAADPTLKAEAEAIETAMQALYQRIGQV
ncbi:hypothetical protein [Brevundimonas goettingensis]|uniref:Uncharacterized protein n=1 Tax=Brevundimonas goettingensis TaxID=2774190 RepID=A0A975BZ15_9CAUL|nr:hypothetical protein [Brevundimonas goettingensis]QTC90436.1 hypothetical protein IFJ75_14285 [Brevundimonas goettingensis]